MPQFRICRIQDGVEELVAESPYSIPGGLTIAIHLLHSLRLKGMHVLRDPHGRKISSVGE